MARERGTGKSITLSDVAQAAGVAPMTVSRYLNAHPNISEKTRKKVSSAIKRLNYTPNLAARILMGQPSNTIGLIVPTLSDAFFSEIAHNIQSVAREKGKLVWVAASEGDVHIEASIVEQMKHHHVDGILLVPTAGSLLKSRNLADVPLVVLDRPLPAACHVILVDNRGGATQMVEHLVSHRYERIVCLSIDSPELYTVGERIAGYQDVMRRHDLKLEIVSSLRSREGVAAWIHAALSSASPPQAVFCTNNVCTIFLIEAFLMNGATLPRELAIGGFDDFEFAPMLLPGITVVRQPARDLGRQAALRLFDRLVQADGSTATVTTTLPTSLILRGSCGCV